jgi:hypothetical protein
MKQDANSSSATAVKADPEAHIAQAPAFSAWIKIDETRVLSPAPPPVWTRYIDSRLKQFCTR